MPQTFSAPHKGKIKGGDYVDVWTSYIDRRKGKKVWKRIQVTRDHAKDYTETPPPDVLQSFKPQKPQGEYVGAKPYEPELIHPDEPQRTHSHSLSQGKESSEHPVSQKHDNDIASSEHRDELINYHKKYYGAMEKPWTEKLGIEYTPDLILRNGMEAERFRKRGVGDVYILNNGLRYFVHSPQLNITKVYYKDHEAEDKVKDIFMSRISKAYIICKANDFIAKQEILSKIGTFILKSDIDVYSKFKSGDSEVSISSNNNNGYLVKLNDSDVLNTDDFSQAMNRYYHCVKNIIHNQVEDMDQGLDAFGDQVVQNNREAMKKLNLLGRTDEYKLLKSLSTEAIAVFFADIDKDVQHCESVNLFEISKADPQNAIIANIPPQEEQDSTSENNVKPRRNELKESDYKSGTKKDLNQEPINEKESGALSPVSIMSKAGEDKTNQYQYVQSQDENKPVKDAIQIPVKSREQKNEAQAPIEEDYHRPILNTMLQSLEDKISTLISKSSGILQKEFPKSTEDPGAISLDENFEGDDKIEEKQKVISGINKLLNKAGFSNDAPTVKIQEKQKPIKSISANELNNIG